MSDKVPSVLFVDDEPNILKSLRRLFIDEEWQQFFATSGEEGLQILAEEPINLVVSDYRMPQMDGRAFLRQVQTLYPDTVRIFLSGYAEKESLAASLAEGNAQMILAKPWDEDELRQTITKSLRQSAAQRDLNDDLQTLINNIPSLPPLPQIYVEVQDCLSDRESLSFEQLGAILEQDVGMTASLLRWANSPIFGQMSKVDTVRRAIVVLGLEVVEGLVLSKSVADSFNTDAVARFDMDAYQLHCMAVGILARQLLGCQGDEVTQEMLDQAFTAGLMHDMGKLVEAHYFPQQMSEAFIQSARDKGLMVDSEKEQIGFSHDEIGGYLASWWNLPGFIVQTVRWHHEPAKARAPRQIPTAVHVADALTQQFGIGLSGNHCPVNVDSERWNRFDLSPERLIDLQQQVESTTAVAH